MRDIEMQVLNVIGEGATEFHEFSLARWEALVLVKWYIVRLLHEYFFVLLTGNTRRSDYREIDYIKQRLNSIAKFLPKDLFQHMKEDGEKQFRKESKVSDEIWRIFLRGDWTEVSDAIQKELND